MSKRFLQFETELRSAVARRAYAEVQAAARRLGAQAEEDWRALAPGDPRARGIFNRLQETLEWARVMVCTSRAAQAGELRRLRLTKRYLSSGYNSGNRLRCDV